MSIKNSFIKKCAAALLACVMTVGTLPVTAFAAAAVTAINAVDITASSAILTGTFTADAGSTVTVGDFEYADNPDFNGYIPVPVNPSGDSFSAEVNGLKPKTEYYYRLKIYHNDGVTFENTVSNSKNFTTGNPPAITVEKPSLMGVSTFNVFFTLPPGYTSVDEGGVIYQENSSSQLVPVAGKRIDETGFRVEVNSFVANKTYTVKAYVKAKYGNSPEVYQYESEPYYHSTTTISKPSVTINSIAPVSGTKITVTGNITNTGGGTISERWFSYYPTDSTSSVSKTTSVTVSGNSFSAEINGVAGKTYKITAYAKNEAGEGNSTEISVPIPSATKTPPTVTTGTVTMPGTTLTASGKITSTGSGTITARGFVYSTAVTSPTLTNATKLSYTGTANDFSASLTNGSATATYYIRAYATNSDGQTGYGSVVTVDTPTVSTESLDTASYAITATGKVTGVNSISKRGFVYSSTNSQPTLSDYVRDSSSASSTYSATITSLTAGKTYYVRAYATNSAGRTKYGTQKNITVTTGSGSAPTVTTETVTMSGTTISANGKITDNGSSSITARGFVYSTTDKTPTLPESGCTNKTSSSSSSSFSATITGLSSGKTYYVRAYATNSYNTGYGSMVEINGYIPTVTTGTPSNIGMDYADVEINVTDDGGYTITERGVVYSSSTTEPTISSSKTDTVELSGKTGKATAQLENLTSNTKYYVRAYARNSQGTAYGDVKNFTTSNNGTVKTVEVTDITGGGATFIGNLISVSGTITEKGFAYDTSSSPTTSDSVISTTSKTSGRYSLDVDDLEPNKTYYVRAYVKTSSGTTYGESVKFKTLNSASAQTSSVSSIETNSATFNGTASNSSNYDITKKGFVYSAVNATPTVSDTTVNHSSTSTGTYSLKVSNLASNTKYYVRAYVQTSQGVTYGTVKTFTTKGATVVVSVDFKTIYGSHIKTQAISVNKGDKLTRSDINVPTGYELYDNAWSYTASVTESVTALVTKTERAFMSGAGNYKFDPERPATRGEVAQSIYDLAVDRTMGSNVKTFSDVPSSHPNKTAIDFCSSRNYMSGLTDGTFRPNEGITRVQMSVVLCNLYKLTGKATASFTDVREGYWGYNFIALVSTNNMMNGYKSGAFGIDNPTTRAEVCTLFSNAERRGLDPLGDTDFVDVPEEHWAYDFIMNAAIATP